ncbi:hypothetical protein Cob_v001494 [Colletotrichum orbiculare MAFF 240422]|uniref:Uncharacterized protein n=1 Tax=Colletotrichum orbiculare (strain 104-T / ATCC 96160 / CBS 514.97 / LARS 414 / MAFF 240422) TaxID=1213857 RepID=N4V5C4_COLOR|nr:hypothetical protein Cob_v001494 [Colletotrichum orbiculare MAFF 240422]
MSRPQRDWELEDRSPSHDFEQKHLEAASECSRTPTSPNPPWPFLDTDEDKRPPALDEVRLPPPSPTERPYRQQQQAEHHQHHQAPTTPRPSPARHVLRYWGLEILTVFVAVCLLAAIIALLAYYDGRYMPEWPFQINLNSAIAFLSTFLRAAIVAAVAEIIGQIKWTWFAEQTRPLNHMQDFDGASRSVLGSLKLLAVLTWNLGFTSSGLLAIGAAAVTVASLAVGPVTQQAVRTSTCPVLQRDANASLPAAHYVPGSSSYYRVGAGTYELEVDMKSTMIQGITDPRGRDSNVRVDCASGNCTWPDWGTGVTHATIGVCGSCIDTTGFVSEPGRGGNLTLPDRGAFVNVQAAKYMWVGYSNLTAYADRFTDDFATAAGVSLANFSVLAVSASPCATDNSTGTPRTTCPHAMSQSDDDAYFAHLGLDYVAASCVLYPCLKEYSGRYRNSTLEETLVRTTAATQNGAESAGSGVSTFAGYDNYTAVQSTCVLDNGTWYDSGNMSAALDVPGRTWANISSPGSGSGSGSGAAVTAVPNACLYKMEGIFFRALSGFLGGELLTGSCVYDAMQSGHINCYESWWLTPLWSDGNATVRSLSTAVDDFAWAVTNKLRMTGLGPDAHRGGDPDAHPLRPAVLGDVWASSTCAYFDSRYVALPVVLVALCALLLACIVAKNYADPDQPVWKGSVLPLLFFGLHDTLGPRVQGAAVPNRDGERLARNTTLFREESGRSAPELDRIQHESGRMWVRFHGGTDPGFLDLGGRKGDAEAGNAPLVPGGKKSSR